MRRALPFLVATVALLVPATARAAPPTCDEFLYGDGSALITAPGNAVATSDPCVPGMYTLAVSTDAANGHADVSGTTLTYTPDAGFHGIDTFFYTATAGADTSDPAEVDVIVDNAPTCGDATVGVVSGQSLVLTASTCSDPDGDDLWVWADSLPQHGTISRRGPLSFAYIPDPGFAGTDSMLFYAEDGFLGSRDASLTIVVTNPLPSNPPPSPRDTAPPVAVLTSVSGQKLKQVLAKGLHVTLASNEAGSATVTVTVDAKTARKLHIKREISRVSAIVSAGKLELTLKLTAKARKAIKKLAKVRLSVRAVVTDAAGNPATRSLTVTLKR
jgi:Bacterial Ig domain